MSFFRVRSLIINNLRQPVAPKKRVGIHLQTSQIEPAMFFDSPTRQASVNDLPIPKADRPPKVVNYRPPEIPAPYFSSWRIVPSRIILKRGK